jgi:putative ABC transport system permease protein
MEWWSMKSEHKIPFFLIFRHIRRGNRWTLGLIIFLMAVAFINLIFINSLFAGIVKSSNNQIIDTYTGHIRMTPEEGQDLIPDSNSILQQLEETAGIQAAAPRVMVPASLRYGEVSGNWQLQAIDPECESRVTIISKKIVEGSYLDVDDLNGIILGRQVAGGTGASMNSSSMEGANVGDRVVITLANESRQLTIRGIFETKYFLTDQMAFINQKTLQALNPSGASDASSILIRLDHPSDETRIINQLRSLPVQATVSGWQDSAGMMNSVVKSFTTVNALLTIVGFVIAAVTIFIIIYVDISHKRRQIGVLRAIGIKARLIRSTYVLQSVVYSLFGVLVGTGIFFGVLVPYFNVHPFSIPLGDVVLAANPIDFAVRAVSVVVVSILAGLIPARLSTRNNILEEITGN